MSGAGFALENACGCCAGVTLRAPMVLYNRAGLDAIGYRIGQHGDILASLQARLSAQEYPALAALRTRDSDDFTIGLLDACASMVDVLGFYQERIANESYLRTAGERLSLRNLARLIGYSLAPGKAAETWLAFTMETPPAAFDTGELVPPSGIPETLTLAPGIQIQNVPGPDETPQTFETVEEFVARPEWNMLRAQQSQAYSLSGRTNVFLDGIGLGLGAGDALLFIGNEFISGSDKSRWQFRIVNAVEPDTQNNRTRVSWITALGVTAPAQDPQVHVLRKRASVFGHNAPMWATMPADFRTNYPANANATDWPAFFISPVAGSVDLDTVHADVVPGSWLVLTTGAATGPFSVSAVSETSRAAFALSGKLTRATLAGDNYASFSGQVRTTAVYAVSERLTLAEAPLTSPVGGSDQLVLDTAIEGLEPERRLIVAGTLVSDGREAADIVTLKESALLEQRTRLTFTQALANTYERHSVVVYGNVARATHGATVHQILGSGAGGHTHQRFQLRHAPLTYVSAKTESGTAPELEVRVGDIAWRREDTLYGRAPDDRSYTVRLDDEGSAQIQFGDGVHGTRLPSGQDNVRAVYRKGLGSEGNIAAGKLAQLLTRPLGLKAVTNPQPAAGGVDAEDEAHARDNIPLGVRTLGRAVSLRDYEDYARAYTGIARARADVLELAHGRTVFISVAGEKGVLLDPGHPTLTGLFDTLRQFADPFVRCDGAGYLPASFRIGLRLVRHPDYRIEDVLDDVENALRAAFSFAARDFGQTVARSEVIAVAHTVPGVAGVDLDRFYRGATAGLADWLSPAAASVNAAGNPVPAELLLLDTGSFDYLEEKT